MKPEEKATELINKFAEHTDMINNTGCVDHELWNKRNKQCALILCETHLYSENNSPFSNIEDWKKDNDKWNRIKTAITNL